ncbi:MAG: hypothetical protein KAU48_13145 [Candidatus Thorarchaeota archaeon]|nr:hypothetical protein [Candidatus Thorarchaeota archaeon]
MLKEILQIMVSHGYLSKELVARQLDLSIATVEDALNLLIRKDYLSRESMSSSGAAACTGCHKKCNIDNSSIFYYKVTERGMKYAEVLSDHVRSAQSS